MKRWKPAILYLLLIAPYLLYWPHAQFVGDDWDFLFRFQQAQDPGSLAWSIVQNGLHRSFRFYWLSYLTAYGLWLTAGPRPQAFFLLALVLHFGCALFLRRALGRLGLDSRLGFLAGALFLVLPTTHSPLFWNLSGSHYQWGLFWFLLYLGSLASSLAAERLDARTGLSQAGLLLLALFSADSSFVLLLATAPIAAWFLRSRIGWRATLLGWSVVLTAAVLYAVLVNQAPLWSSGLGVRYRFSALQFWRNLMDIFETYRRTTGLGAHPFYHLNPSAGAVAAAVLAGLAVWWEGRERPAARLAVPGRVLLLALLLWIAAQGPTWFLRTHEFRYEYVPSAFLAMALGWVVLRLPRFRRAAAGVLLGAFALASVNDLQQSWIPQSRHLRAITQALGRVDDLQPGDLLIVPDTPLWIGTAPHFAFQAGWFSDPYVQLQTGVRPVETAVQIVREEGRLRVQHFNYARDLGPEELLRTHVLGAPLQGPAWQPKLLAESVAPNAFRLRALHGYKGSPLPTATLTREQLTLAQSDIYFVRTISAGTH